MTSTSSFTAAIFHLLIMVQGVSWALNITQLQVPTSVAVGGVGWLQCDWVDEGDRLYTLRWYFGIDEFYRWTPNETPSARIFPMPHFLVDSRVSHGGRVLLRNITSEAEGSYLCEATGEAPTFISSYGHAFMSVVYMPDHRPRITDDGRGPYRVNQLITVSCVFHGAKPAPFLTFYVNDQPINPSWNTFGKVVVNETSRLETAVKALEFPLRPSMVGLGSLKVKCVAYVPDLHWISSVKLLSLDLPRNYSNLVESDLELYGSSCEIKSHTLPIIFVFLFNLLLQ